MSKAFWLLRGDSHRPQRIAHTPLATPAGTRPITCQIRNLISSIRVHYWKITNSPNSSNSLPRPSTAPLPTRPPLPTSPAISNARAPLSETSNPTGNGDMAQTPRRSGYCGATFEIFSNKKQKSNSDKARSRASCPWTSSQAVSLSAGQGGDVYPEQSLRA